MTPVLPDRIRIVKREGPLRRRRRLEWSGAPASFSSSPGSPLPRFRPTASPSYLRARYCFFSLSSSHQPCFLPKESVPSSRLPAADSENSPNYPLAETLDATGCKHPRRPADQSLSLRAAAPASRAHCSRPRLPCLPRYTRSSHNPSLTGLPPDGPKDFHVSVDVRCS